MRVLVRQQRIPDTLPACFKEGVEVEKMVCNLLGLIKIAEAEDSSRRRRGLIRAPTPGTFETAFRQTVELAESLVRDSGECMATEAKDHAVRELEDGLHFFEKEEYLSAADAIGDVV